METIVLKPCPFCGHKPETNIDALDDSLHPVTRDRRVWSMNCNECEGGCGASVLAGSRERAVETWNERASTSKPDLVAYWNEWLSKQTDYDWETLFACRPDLEDRLIQVVERKVKHKQESQDIECKAQWDEVARILGADGDDVDDVFAKARQAHATVAQEAGANEVKLRVILAGLANAYSALPGAITFNGSWYSHAKTILAQNTCPDLDDNQYAAVKFYVDNPTAARLDFNRRVHDSNTQQDRSLDYFIMQKVADEYNIDYNKFCAATTALNAQVTEHPVAIFWKGCETPAPRGLRDYAICTDPGCFDMFSGPGYDIVPVYRQITLAQCVTVPEIWDQLSDDDGGRKAFGLGWNACRKEMLAMIQGGKHLNNTDVVEQVVDVELDKVIYEVSKFLDDYALWYYRFENIQTGDLFASYRDKLNHVISNKDAGLTDNNAGRVVYNGSVTNSHNLQCRAWSELSEHEKQMWNDRAASSTQPKKDQL